MIKHLKNAFFQFNLSCFCFILKSPVGWFPLQYQDVLIHYKDHSLNEHFYELHLCIIMTQTLPVLFCNLTFDL